MKIDGARVLIYICALSAMASSWVYYPFYFKINGDLAQVLASVVSIFIAIQTYLFSEISKYNSLELKNKTAESERLGAVRAIYYRQYVSFVFLISSLLLLLGVLSLKEGIDSALAERIAFSISTFSIIVGLDIPKTLFSLSK